MVLKRRCDQVESHVKDIEGVACGKGAKKALVKCQTVPPNPSPSPSPPTPSPSPPSPLPPAVPHLPPRPAPSTQPNIFFMLTGKCKLCLQFICILIIVWRCECTLSSPHGLPPSSPSPLPFLPSSSPSFIYRSRRPGYPIGVDECNVFYAWAGCNRCQLDQLLRAHASLLSFSK